MELEPARLDRIRRHLPDLEITSIEVNYDGMVNDVVVLNGERVVRFAKHDWGRELMAAEARILEVLRPRVDLAVPDLELLDHDVCTYRFLPGAPTTRSVLLRMTEVARVDALRQLGEFLAQMHQLAPEITADLPRSDAERDVHDWLKLYDDVRATLFPHLYRHQRDWVDEHFAGIVSGDLDLTFSPVLVHADLAPYHVLHDPAEGRLTAVIDFGTAGLGDPAADLAMCLVSFGESLAARMRYPGFDALLPRARFWAGTLELQWSLAGIRHDDPGLAVAHIGGARDVGVS